jgi:hypothetical protein
MYAGEFSVSLTILYRHPQRPDETGMTVVAGEVEAAARKDHLEHQGFLVVKIETAPFGRTVPIPCQRRRH